MGVQPPWLRAEQQVLSGKILLLAPWRQLPVNGNAFQDVQWTMPATKGLVTSPLDTSRQGFGSAFVEAALRSTVRVCPHRLALEDVGVGMLSWFCLGDTGHTHSYPSRAQLGYEDILILRVLENLPVIQGPSGDADA